MEAGKQPDFFTDIENTAPYLKLGAQGFAGSGKTFTLATIAVGLHKRIGSTLPIAVYDTEGSSKFLKPFFASHGIEGIRKSSKALSDLEQTILMCEQGAADILMIDSISHVWEGYIETYKSERKVDRLSIDHWGRIKPMWKRRFSQPFVHSAVHILMTGRAGYEYGFTEKDEEGKRELIKTGTKMRVEGETAYEPDILIEMERFEAHMPSGKRDIWREAVVLKDRADLIDGLVFRDPTYADFEPAIEYILADAKPAPAPAAGSDAALVTGEVAQQVVLEEIESLMTSVAPGGSAKEKRWKAEVLQAIFATGSWTQVKLLPTEKLAEGRDRIGEIVRAVKAERAAEVEAGA